MPFVGNIQLSKCVPPFSYIYYTGNRVLLYVILEIESSSLPFAAVSFSPQQMGNPMKKVTLTLKSVFNFLSIQT